MSRPALLAVAHGSRDPDAQHTVEEVTRRIRDTARGVPVRCAYLQNAEPSFASVLPASGAGTIVVPLLLSHGYHSVVDVTEAAAAFAAPVAPVLGPDPLLCDALLDRLEEAGASTDAPIVLAAAGSTDARAFLDTSHQAALLRSRTRGTRRTVVAAVVTGVGPRVDEVVPAVRSETGRQPVVASYVLAPGAFARRIKAAAPGVVSRPLGAHPAVVALAVARYEQAARALSCSR